MAPFEDDDQSLGEMLRLCGELKRALHRRRYEQRRWTTPPLRSGYVAGASLAERFLKLTREVLAALEDDADVGDVAEKMGDPTSREAAGDADGADGAASVPKRRCCAPRSWTTA